MWRHLDTGPTAAWGRKRDSTRKTVVALTPLQEIACEIAGPEDGMLHQTGRLTQCRAHELLRRDTGWAQYADCFGRGRALRDPHGGRDLARHRIRRRRMLARSHGEARGARSGRRLRRQAAGRRPGRCRSRGCREPRGRHGGPPAQLPADAGLAREPGSVRSCAPVQRRPAPLRNAGASPRNPASALPSTATAQRNQGHARCPRNSLRTDL